MQPSIPVFIVVWQEPLNLTGPSLIVGRTPTDQRGHSIRERPITPSDIAAMVFRHLGIDLDAQWTNPQGRPIPIVTEGGQPIRELF